jgi:hypothetical protein
MSFEKARNKGLLLLSKLRADINCLSHNACVSSLSKAYYVCTYNLCQGELIT